MKRLTESFAENANRRKVYRYIKDNIILDDFRIEPLDLFPGGIMITHKNGDALLFYHDIFSGKVIWRELKEKE